MTETATKRAGTLTLGISLIFFGILFILRTFTDIISYTFVFKLWPIIFIFLGLEILISYTIRKETALKYDKVSIFLIILLSLFAMVMACAEFLVDNKFLVDHILY